MYGDSTLSPSNPTEDSINFSRNNKVEITIVYSNGSIPYINLGQIGSGLIYPKSFTIEIDLSGFNSTEQIEEFFSHPIKIMSGRTLNAKQWIQKNVILLKIVGFGNPNILKITYSNSSKSTLLESDPETTIYVEYNSHVNPSSKDKSVTTGAIVGIVIVVVVIVAAVIIFVSINMKKKKQLMAQLSVQSMQSGALPETSYT